MQELGPALEQGLGPALEQGLGPAMKMMALPCSRWQSAGLKLQETSLEPQQLSDANMKTDLPMNWFLIMPNTKILIPSANKVLGLSS